VDDAIPRREEVLSATSRDRGLPRPLLCVMLGHVKNWAFARVLRSSLPDAEIAQPLLDAYFPTQMRVRYREHFASHPLRREIIATAAVNYLINNAGVSFIHRVTHVAAREIGDVVQAYLLADRDANAQEARQRLVAANLPVADEHAQLVQIEDALEAATVQLLRNEHVDLPAVLNGARGVV
jgi:glutamate dehydrogenase